MSGAGWFRHRLVGRKTPAHSYAVPGDFDSGSLPWWCESHGRWEVRPSGDPMPTQWAHDGAVPYGQGHPSRPCDECAEVPGRHCCLWNFDDPTH